MRIQIGEFIVNLGELIEWRVYGIIILGYALIK